MLLIIIFSPFSHAKVPTLKQCLYFSGLYKPSRLIAKKIDPMIAITIWVMRAITHLSSSIQNNPLAGYTMLRNP